MHIALERANQENLIKDFKYGLGLSHVPTGFFLANQIYFKIAALAWNIKTWMLNLLSIGDGAVLRFKRFLYLWINHACVVSKTGRETIVIRMDPGGVLFTLRERHRFNNKIITNPVTTRPDYLCPGNKITPLFAEASPGYMSYSSRCGHIL